MPFHPNYPYGKPIIYKRASRLTVRWWAFWYELGLLRKPCTLRPRLIDRFIMHMEARAVAFYSERAIRSRLEPEPPIHPNCRCATHE
jgi:hypothetical protein